MRLYTIIFLVLTVFLPSCNAQNTTSIASEMKGFEKEVDSLLNVYHTVGASVAIIKDGKMVYADGFGYKNLEKKIPADKNTVYGIGSCSKAFTAALFGILESKKELSLSDLPNKYIPELEFYNAEMNNTIALKNILCHNTGLPSVSTESSAVFFRSNDKNVIIPRLKHLPPQTGVGETWIYNNYLYALAGRITERVTNKSWQDNLSHYIFNPLSMNATYGNVTPASKDINFSLGYGVSRRDTIPMQVLAEDFPTRDAGGNIYSNALDMAKWLKVWINKGMHQEKSFLSKNYIKEAIGKQQLIHSDSITGIDQYYGYGWMNSVQEGHLKVEHSGGISGYSSNVVFFPDDNLGIIVLSNQNTAGISFAITNAIIKRVLNIETPSNPNEPYFSTVVTIEDPATDTIINTENPPTHSLENFVGEYSHPGFGTIVVTYENNTLYADVPFTKFRLEHQANNVFLDYFTERKSQVVGNFLEFNFQSEEGSEKIDRVLLNIDTEPVRFLRKNL